MLAQTSTCLTKRACDADGCRCTACADAACVACLQYEKTPLFKAAGTGKIDCVRLLLERGAKIDQPQHVRAAPGRCVRCCAAADAGLAGAARANTVALGCVQQPAGLRHAAAGEGRRRELQERGALRTHACVRFPNPG
jgi:hypothetical protein